MNRTIIGIAVAMGLAAGAPGMAATTPAALAAAGQAPGVAAGTHTGSTGRGEEPSGKQREHAAGPLAPLAKRLADHGIYLRANLIDQYAHNTRGGVMQGHTNVGQFNIGADIDLGKAMGINGGSFHFTVYRDYGHGLNHDITGTFTKQQ